MTIKELHKELTRILKNNICDPNAAILVDEDPITLRDLDEVNFTSGDRVLILKAGKYHNPVFGN